MGAYDKIRMDVQVHAETETAVKVSRDGNAKGGVWLPKSLVRVEDETSDGFGKLIITEALATAKGLV